MTREQKILRARELREEGLSYPAIGRQLGVNLKTAYCWLNPDAAKQYARRDNAKRAAAKRKWENENDRGTCEQCGGQTMVGAKRKGVRLCRECWEGNCTQRQDRIVALYREGLLPWQIAERLSVSPAVVSTVAYRARLHGLDVPRAPTGYRSHKQVAA